MSVARRRVLVVTDEPLGAVLSGPAIRAVEIATALAAGHQVVVLTMGGASSGGRWSERGLRCVVGGPRQLRQLASKAEVVVVQGDVLWRHRWLAGVDVPIVVDLYDPFHLEQLEQARDLGERRRQEVVRDCVAALNFQLRRGDFFLCASERQRDLWLGHLAGMGRVNPRTYDEDPMLRSLLAVVPFGVPAEPPTHRRAVVKGVLPGIAPGDRLLLWGGGIYNWLDPLTLVRAVGVLGASAPDVRLLFLGTGHPNPAVPTMRMAVEVRELAAGLGLAGGSVFFRDGWVPYDERGAYLLEADLGVSTHLDHVESYFSFRTRVLDYLWAGLPVVVTRGDALAATVEAHGLGTTVPPGDVEALAGALQRTLDPQVAAGCRERIAAVRERLGWPQAVAPLAAFCASPRRAADLVDPAVRADLGRLQAPTSGPGRLLAAARYTHAEGGYAAVLAGVARLVGRHAPGGQRRPLPSLGRAGANPQSGSPDR